MKRLKTMEPLSWTEEVSQSPGSRHLGTKCPCCGSVNTYASVLSEARVGTDAFDDEGDLASSLSDDDFRPWPYAVCTSCDYAWRGTPAPRRHL